MFLFTHAWVNISLTFKKAVDLYRNLWLKIGALVTVILLCSSDGFIVSRELPVLIREARQINVGEVGVQESFGLAFSPTAQMFLVLAPSQRRAAQEPSSGILMFNFFGDRTGSLPGLGLVEDPVNVAFDESSNTLLLMRRSKEDLIAVKMAENGLPGARQVSAVDGPYFRDGNPQGMTFDSASGRLYILDSDRRQIVGVDLNLVQSDGSVDTLTQRRINRIELGDEELSNLRGIAFNPRDDHLYVLHPGKQTLYKLSERGQIVAIFNLSGLGLVNPTSIIFAPSGDLTDEARRISLYVTDSGRNGRGRIVELAFSNPIPHSPTVQNTDAFLVQVIDTSQFDPPSPDTAGVTYISDEDRLLMSDSEVSEMPIYEGANVFISSLSGELSSVFNTLSFSDEPTGVAYKPDGQRLFISDDTADEVFELGGGTDGIFGTEDDDLSSFDTRAIGSGDPEGIAYEGVENRLFFVDGINAEVYEVLPGPNGEFDGIDDVISQFDTESLGVVDPEGVEFNPDTGNLYIVGQLQNTVLEVTTTGELVQLIDISEANPRRPAGLAYGRQSNDPSQMSLYVAERGVDNDTDPNENDGEVYEFGLNIAASSPTPTPIVTKTPTPTPTPSSTVESPGVYALYISYFSGGSNNTE